MFFSKKPKEPRKPRHKTNKEKMYEDLFFLLVWLFILVVVIATALQPIDDSESAEETNFEDNPEGFWICTSIIFIVIILGIHQLLDNYRKGGEFTKEWLKYEEDLKSYKKNADAKKKAEAADKQKALEEAEEILTDYIAPEESNKTGEEPSKECEHCDFLNNASNNPYWASMYDNPKIADFVKGSVGCNVVCISCGYNFWVSSAELAGEGPDSGVQLKSFAKSKKVQDAHLAWFADGMSDVDSDTSEEMREFISKRKKKASAKSSVVSNTVKSRLKDAKAMFDEGLIDEEEYKQMKKDILAKS